MGKIKIKRYKPIDNKKFLDLYKNGKTFEEIAQEIDNIAVNVQKYYYEHYFAWERLEIDREHHNNRIAKEV